MRFNFKKISALATSTILMGMTMGVAAAANYPAPFVAGGSADVAIVYGTGEGVSALDAIEAGNIQSNLQSHMGSGGGSEADITGEAYGLFSSSTKLYMNDSLDTVKSSLTETQLPNVLADSDFEGNVNADVTQSIKLGSVSRAQFGNHPTDDDDPQVAITMGTINTQYMYNTTVSFNKAVNLTDPDSIGESLHLFGQEFTIGAGTTNANLYLYKSSQKIALSIGGSDSSDATVTVDGSTYTVELTGATASTATIKVTDSNGNSDTKEVTEDNSKKIQGLDVSVSIAASSEATSTESATITVGANKLQLTHTDQVKEGSDATAIEGTYVHRSGAAWGNVTSFSIQIYAADTDNDAFIEGTSFIDPVFGTFKLDFAGTNAPEGDSSREDIIVKPSGNDKATIAFASHTGDHTGESEDGTFTWYYNVSSHAVLADSNGRNISVVDMEIVNKSRYLVVGNEDKGYLMKVQSIYNSTTDATGSDDYVELKDMLSGKIYKSGTASAEGTTTVDIEGTDYTVTYNDIKANANDEHIRLNQADSSTDEIVIYPTIETSKGAKLFFYQPIIIDMVSWDGSDNYATNTTTFKFPDGDGYTDIDFTSVPAQTGIWNMTTGTASPILTNGTSNGTDVSIGQLTYQINGSGTINDTVVYLEDVDGVAMHRPAIVMFEEQDDATTKVYNAIIFQMEGGGSSTDGVGVADVELTWADDGYWDDKKMQSTGNTDYYKGMDYYGAIFKEDRTDSSQYSATVSYPDDQVYVQVFIAEEDASITAGTTGSSSSTPLGEVIVKDTEVSSVSSKNLIVVGGSCINSAAEALVGGAYCGADWTTATDVGTGQFLIKSYATSSLTTKLALLVAGYDAADTVNAAKYLRTKTVDTSKEYKGTSSTSAEEVVTTVE